jgi:hypothetical protein
MNQPEFVFLKMMKSIKLKAFGLPGLAFISSGIYSPYLAHLVQKLWAIHLPGG